MRTGALPRTLRDTLVYSTTAKLDPSAGNMASAYFRASSIFDPQFAVGGHQPRGHDTLAQFYKHYKVLKAVCSFTFSNCLLAPFPAVVSGSAPGGTEQTCENLVNVNVGMDKDGTNPPVITGDLTSINEVNGSQFAVINQNSTPKKLSVTYTPRGYYGPHANDLQIGADFGANPANIALFRITSTAIDPAVNQVQLQVQVHIKYFVELSERLDDATS